MMKSKILVNNNNDNKTSREDEGRGLASVGDGGDTLVLVLEDYIKKSKERVTITANNNINILSTDRRTTITRKQK